jgi:hypothetical protein
MSYTLYTNARKILSKRTERKDISRNFYVLRQVKFFGDPGGGSLTGIAGSNPAGASVVCCQVEVSATGRSLVQRSPSDCGV